jgi:hypothetical protein
MLTGPVRKSAQLMLLILLGWAAGARAQDGDWASKLFDEQSHDFGVVAKGAEVKHLLKVTNRTNGLVHISGVRTSCGCTSASIAKTSLNSGEATFIQVTLDTVRHERKKESNVIVTFDAPNFRELYIPIKAYIRTDVVLTPGSVEFGTVEQGSKAERKIDISYAGRPDWRIREVRTNNSNLDATIVQKQRNGGQASYELVVTLKETAPVGNHNQQIMLVTDDAANPYVPVLVHAKVEADMTVTVAEGGALGLLRAGDTKSFQVVIRATSGKPFAIEKIECESDLNAFAVRLPDSSRPVHVLPITMMVPDKPGKFVEKFIVTVNGRPEPVMFQASGEIASAPQ